jgi:hypothetical protein
MIFQYVGKTVPGIGGYQGVLRRAGLQPRVHPEGRTRQLPFVETALEVASCRLRRT